MPTVLKTYLENRWEVQPNHSNNLESAHGGNVMKWMDGIGGLSAMRFAGNTCITAKMGAIEFKQPIPTGQTVLVESWVFDTGETSMDVRLKTFREDPRSGETTLTSETMATYVAIDEDKTPVSVPDLEIVSQEGKRLVTEATEATRDKRE